MGHGRCPSRAARKREGGDEAGRVDGRTGLCLAFGGRHWGRRGGRRVEDVPRSLHDDGLSGLLLCEQYGRTLPGASLSNHPHALA